MQTRIFIKEPIINMGATLPGPWATLLGSTLLRSNLLGSTRTFLAFLHVMSLVICPVPDTNLHKWVSHKRHHFKSCWVNLGGVNLTGGSTFPGSTLLGATVTRFSYAFLISRFFLEFLHVMSLVICPVADTNLHKGAHFLHWNQNSKFWVTWPRIAQSVYFLR